MVLVCCVYMYFVRDLANEAGEYDYKLYVLSLLVFVVNTMIDLTRATSMASFMARVSDESIGGTYMTFLATLANLGGKFPSTGALYLINWLTIKYCNFDPQKAMTMTQKNISILSTNSSILAENSCSTTDQTKVN